MEVKEYKKEISSAFSSHARGGFVDWRNCSRLYQDVTGCLENASRNLSSEQRYAELFDLCNWTFVKWNKTDKDDSYGETQEFCDCVSEIWESIYREGEQSLSHSKMLEGFLKILAGKESGDLEDYIFRFILGHFKNEDELAKKEMFLAREMDDLKKRIPEEDILKYTLYVLEEYYAQVLADQRRPIEEIRVFLRASENYRSRELMAQIETLYGNYPEAVSLYRELIAEHPDGFRSNSYRKALMDIFRMQGDTESYNEELYGMMMYNPSETNYFLEYRALFTEEEWKREWADLLVKYRARMWAINPWLNLEGRYDLIMDNAEPDNESVLELYGDRLFPLYPERCLKVMANATDNLAVNSNNRRDYRYIARMLRKMSRYPGGRELAGELAEKYRKQYPRRPALLDELKKF